MSVRIRAYDERDRDVVIDLARELQANEVPLFDRMKPADAIGAWYVEHLKAECAQHGGTILIAEESGVAVGYATILTEMVADAADEERYVFAHVGDLSVTATRRGTGIGTALLAACERIAREAGRDELRIDVLSGNVRARRVYEQCGFGALLVTMRKKIV